MGIDFTSTFPECAQKVDHFYFEHRKVINGIFLVFYLGSLWRDLPD